MNTNTLTVHTVLDLKKTISVPFEPGETTAEDVCTFVCKLLEIGPVCRHLFALRLRGTSNFHKPSATFDSNARPVDFRIRFKAASIARLSKTDKNAYDYYFYQARSDVLQSQIPKAVYKKYSNNLMGLSVIDIFRVMLEQALDKRGAKDLYTKHIPKELVKKHSIGLSKFNTYEKCIDKQVDQLVEMRNQYTPSHFETKYLKQFDEIVPEYLEESFEAKIEGSGFGFNADLKMSPYHPQTPGLLYRKKHEKASWVWICSTKDFQFVSVSKDERSVQVCRRNGVPFGLDFSSKEAVSSFVGLVDGYYRLTAQWTYNLCSEVWTPSLRRLAEMKSHGPVGGAFSFAKLTLIERESHSFIIRESETEYNVYYVDYLKDKNYKPKTYKLDRLQDGSLRFHCLTESVAYTTHPSVQDLMNCYKDPNGDIFLHKCIRPSEHDEPPLLLLCKVDKPMSDTMMDSSELSPLLTPVCINTKDLQEYKDEKRVGSFCAFSPGRWRVATPEGSKKVRVGLKMLRQDKMADGRADIEALAGRWSFLRSGELVRMYGVTFVRGMAMVTEYFERGPLDKYLRSNSKIVREADLMEAASNLAAALYYLGHENRFVHGRIRCRKLMVCEHDERRFRVKLADPGVFDSYGVSELHWIPAECYANLGAAKTSPEADVYAFATTLWEIFSMGPEMDFMDGDTVRQFYLNGMRLARPPPCPDEMFELIEQCWNADVEARLEPQAIMRDVNQMMFEVENRRNAHAYTYIDGDRDYNLSLSSSARSVSPLGSSASIGTDTTTVCDAPDAAERDRDRASALPFDAAAWLAGWLDALVLPRLAGAARDPTAAAGGAFGMQIARGPENALQCVFELEDGSTVTMVKVSGKGCHGEVWEGNLQKKQKSIDVAIKRLKRTATRLTYADFQREIKIMQRLNHPNIVRILGFSLINDERDGPQEPLLVMEFMEKGSLINDLLIYSRSRWLALCSDGGLGMKVLGFALDMAKGMRYLSEKKIVHRDLAARNVLITADYQHVKISDFGMAQMLGGNDCYRLKTDRLLPLQWYAPEVLNNWKYSTQSDVWSYGVTVWEMFTIGEKPRLERLEQKADLIGSEDQRRWWQALEAGSRYPQPKHCSDEVFQKFVEPCWRYDPKDRPTFAVLVNELISFVS